MPEGTNSGSDDEEISTSSKRLAGLARGYTFQDIIAGSCILSVFFEDANAVAVESKLTEDDKFDDIILEKEGEKICLQLKNGPEHRLISSDLTGSNERGLDFTDLSESAEARREAEEGSRFVVLTSFENETGSGIEFSDETEQISLFGSLEFGARKLIDFRGGEVGGGDIEFVLGIPGVGTTTDDEKVESLRNTTLFERTVESVARRLDARENPEIEDPYSLTKKAVDLARWARNQPVDVQRLDRGEVIHRLELSPSKKLEQEFTLPEGYIRPDWIEELETVYYETGDRVLVEGRPGSGKSVGIELFHRSLEDSEDYRTLRFYLYIPEDADSLEKKRSDPDWFRHQLAAQIYATFPEAFEEDSSAPVWTGTEDLQRYLDNVAQWADEEDQRILFIIDGLDHALRQFGGTSATESAEGTVLEEIGLLDFSDPLSLLMVGREITEAHSTLQVDNQIDVPPWEEKEIEEYLERKNIPLEDGFIEQVREVSGGLPVIISHLVRKAEIQEGSVEEGLQSAIENASHVDGELERYYNTIWEPLKSYERDVVSLVALNPTGLRGETINSVIDLPYIQDETQLEEAPLAHILDPADNGRFRVFHDSFRKFTEDQLDQQEVEQGHVRLYKHIFDQCMHFPQNLESLKYHAENGPGRSALKDLASLENLLYWWQEGIHLEHLSNTLELSFNASLRDGDYTTAVDCMMLGGVARNMFNVYLEDDSRLKYFAAQDDRDKALRLMDQIQVYDGGSKEAIKAMQIVGRNWADVLDQDWLAEWEKDHQGAEQSSWDPEAFFEVASLALEPETFWGAAEQIKRDDTGDHFSRAVLSAVQKKPELFESQSGPPEWLFENGGSVALQVCEELIYDLPDAWREELNERAPECSDLSLAALHTLVRCGDVDGDIREIIEERELNDPVDGWGGDNSQFYDAYYLGSIVAALDESSEELLELVDDIAVDQPRTQKLLALIGAASTGETSNQREYWINITLEYLVEVFEQGYLIDLSARNVDEIRYWQAVSDVFERFEEVASEGSEDLIRQVVELWKETGFEDRFIDTVGRSLNRAWEELHPEEVFPEGFEQRYTEIMRRPPDEEPPSRDLLDLGIRAAREDYSSLGEKCVENAVECCFRYGYRKDRFLDDVWEGLEDIENGEWNHHLGTAIQLVNWAGLLHELTDGKGTTHLEGKFLASLLNDDAIDYHTAEEHATYNSTQRRLWSWRLENPEGLTKNELSSLIYVRETKLRSRHSKMALPFFSKAAEVADNYGWDELAIKALYALTRGDYVRDGISSEREEKLRELASEYDVDIPDDLDPDNGSSGFERENEDSESGDNPAREILTQHSEEDQLSADDFENLTVDQLSTAGELLQRDTINSRRYNPTAAAPLSQALVERGEEEKAIALLENVIAERDLMNSWLGGGRERFQVVAQALLDIDQERALQSVLNGWRKSRLDTLGYQSIIPQLLWIVKRAEGEMAAEELFSNVMGWTRRLMHPYEDWVQRWGVLESPGP